MPPTVITGVRGTSDVLTVSKRIEMADKIYILDPSAAPFTLILNRLNKSVSGQQKFSWLEDEDLPVWSNCVSNAGTGSTINVTTGNGAYFKKNDLVKVPSTNEVMLVTDVVSDALTVIRGYGTTSATSIDGSSTPVPLFNLGTAFMEGSQGDALVAKSTQVVEKFGYVQIMQELVQVTQTQDNIELYGKPSGDRAYQRNKKGREMMIKMERNFLFGEPGLDTGTKDATLTKPRYMTGGLNHYIQTNRTDVGGTLTEWEWETFLRTGFRYGNNTKYFFCSPLIVSVISQWAQGKLEMKTSEKLYGIAIGTYLSPHGTVRIVKHQLLEGATYGGYGFLVDMESMAYRYIKNRDVHLVTNVHDTKGDIFEDKYLAEIGLEVRQEKRHSALMGVAG